MRVDFKFGVGDRVEPIDARGLEAVVSAASVDDGGKREYRLVFWHDASRRVEWVAEHELRPVELRA